MKLISCHIENFGKLRNANYSFGEALVALCEENGYGKTTLAAFLKAMFYGMDSDRANAAFNDRRHFCPFYGGRFGGNITFEADGAQYRIERFFDAKSESKDELTMYCNGRRVESNDVPGRFFFGIDKESFERTVFISGADVKILSTGNINTKLNAFVRGGADDADYEAASARLTAKIKQYQKARGEGGLISDESKKLNDISAQISGKKTIELNLAPKYVSLDALNGEISRTTARIVEAQSENVALANWESYERMTDEIEQKKNKIRAIDAQYPYGLPSRAETETVKKAMEMRSSSASRLEQKSFTDEDETRYAELKNRYGAGPGDDAIEEIRKEIANEKQLSFRLNAKNEIAANEREQTLLMKFHGGAPSAETVKRAETLAENYKSAERQYGEISDFSQSASGATIKPHARNKKPFVVVAIIAALLMAAGVAVLFFSMLAGIATLILGLLALIAVGFVYLSKKTETAGVAVTENPEKRRAKERLDRLQTELQAALLPYGYSFENGAKYAAASFLDDVKNHAELLARLAERDAEAARLNAELQTLREKISSFFDKYGVSDRNYDMQLERLSAELSEYEKLTARRADWLKQKDALTGNVSEQDKIISEFCRKYKISPENAAAYVEAAEQSALERSALAEAVAVGEKKAETFRTDKALSSRPESGAADLAALNERLSDLQDKKAGLVKQIAEDESETETLDDLQSEYDETKATLEQYRADHAALTRALEFLDRADKSLKDRYVRPVKDSFMKYSDGLERAIGEKITINPDFQLLYEDGGAQHSDEHLSAGQRSLCALCFRLALIDNMYPKEKPFVILDDPFASLDETHLEKAIALLRDISSGMQLIYFTCHKSRAI